MGEREKTYLSHPLFPNSATAPFEISSPETDDYNCMGWALGEMNQWWEAEEGLTWLPNIPFDDKLKTVNLFFETFEFQPCQNAAIENGLEKIALFSLDGIHCEHVARQLPDGRWTSKLGEGYDVIHSLEGMENGMYGNVTIFMQRRNSTSAENLTSQ